MRQSRRNFLRQFGTVALAGLGAVGPANPPSAQAGPRYVYVLWRKTARDRWLLSGPYLTYTYAAQVAAQFTRMGFQAVIR